MNAKVWAITKSNSTLGHAFPEATDGKAVCNRRTVPGGTLVTREVLEATGGVRICERCAFRMAHLAREAEAEANPVQALTPEDAKALADSDGYVMFLGNANKLRKPSAYPSVVRFVDMGGNLFALRDKNGRVECRVKGTTKLYVRRLPANYDAMVAEAEAQAEAVEINMVEVSAPIAQAERVSEPAHVSDEDQDQDVTLTAQDIEDAALGACEWDQDATEGARYGVGQTVDYTRASDVAANIPNGPVEVTRVIDHGPDARYSEGGRFTYVGRVPGIAKATQGASEGELAPIEGAPQLDAQAVTEAQETARREAYAADDRAEREAREAAAQRLEALRAPEVTAEVEFKGTHKNIQHMITYAPNEKARASWARVAAYGYHRDHVMAHAKANAAHGWDVVLETLTSGEILAMILGAGVESVEDAIAYVRETVVDPYRERQADALISAWGF